MYRVFIVLLYLRVVGCSEARRTRGGAQSQTYSLDYLYKHFGEVNESGSPNLGTSPGRSRATLQQAECSPPNSHPQRLA